MKHSIAIEAKTLENAFLLCVTTDAPVSVDAAFEHTEKVFIVRDDDKLEIGLLTTVLDDVAQSTG